jgi:hypothetical protein
VPEESTAIWRVRPAGRAGAIGVVVLWLALSSAITATLGFAGGATAMLWVVVVLVVPLAWLLGFRPYLALTSDSVIIQNPLLRTAISYDQIACVKGGYYGLLIRTRDGDAKIAWAVQKSNLAKWTRTRTRADEVADAILARLPAPLEARQEPPVGDR